MFVPEVAIVFAAVRNSSAETHAAGLKTLCHFLEPHTLREADNSRRGQAIADAHEGVERAGSAHELISPAARVLAVPVSAASRGSRWRSR